MFPAPTDDLAHALDAAGTLVAGVRADQWDRPTPCPDWDVRALVTHLVLGHRLFAGVLTGGAPVDNGALAPTASGALDPDPVAAHREAAELLLTAFGRPGVLETVVEVPFGAVPGAVAASLRTVETLVHGDDLARATGQHTAFADGVAERALAFTAAALPTVPPGGPFAPPRPVADDAPPMDRLVALLGRSVTWPSPGR